jgi:oligopeptide/dipeptide ABC transporter ATP-binding protein
LIAGFAHDGIYDPNPVTGTAAISRRQRRFSALKASVFVLMFVPAIRLVDEFVNGQLGIYPPDLMNLPPGCAFAPRCKQVQPVCEQAVPSEVSIGHGHRARCVLLSTDAAAK